MIRYKTGQTFLLNWLLYIPLCLLLFLSGCQDWKQQGDQDLLEIQGVAHRTTKPVILFVVDSLMSQALEAGLQQGELPTFQWLIEQGQYYPQVVSPFPTMSVTIDSSLLTGAYPHRHQVPGLIWYDQEEKRVINYGTGWREIVQHGVNSFLLDAVISLNNEQLSKQERTLFEELQELGFTTGIINGLIYRGYTPHTLSVPAWLHLPTELPKQLQVQGPDFLSLGVFSNPLEEVVDLPVGLFDRFGFNNQYALETVKYLITNDNLPDFLYVYLPDLDQEIHKDGPPGLEGVHKLDQALTSVLDSFGSREKALQEVVFLFIGDSGQTKIGENEEAVIYLEVALADFNVLPSGEQASQETEIILAVNERMAYVYTLSPSIHDLVYRFQGDPRIDSIAWKEKEWIYVRQGGNQDGELSYKPQGNYLDEYGQNWEIEGDWEVLDLEVNQHTKQLEYGAYPDALMRLWSALHSHHGEYLVLTAKPGYELATMSSPQHLGGAGHGSLHQTDSLVPLIITGTDEQPPLLRIVNLKEYLLRLVTN